MEANVFQRVLVVYKKSAYKIYFLERKSSLFGKQALFKPAEIRRFKLAHETHYRTLAFIEEILRRYKIRFRKRRRGQRIDASGYDLIITVGGDGTFLEAARSALTQPLWGVNSDPAHSVGRFCSTRPEHFERDLVNLLKGNFRTVSLHRFRLELRAGKNKRIVNVLNDLLFCHQNPAAMSRYYLTINKIREEQRGSGLWVSTAAGSSGAIHSAGGQVIPRASKLIQYRPREIFSGFHAKYRLTGGMLFLHHPILIESIMRSGRIYIDGAHLSFSFGLGNKAILTNSLYPANVIQFKA